MTHPRSWRWFFHDCLFLLSVAAVSSTFWGALFALLAGAYGVAVVLAITFVGCLRISDYMLRTLR